MVDRRQGSNKQCVEDVTAGRWIAPAVTERRITNRRQTLTRNRATIVLTCEHSSFVKLFISQSSTCFVVY